MEIGKMRPRPANDLWNRFSLRTHRFHIENDLEIGRTKLPNELNGFGRRIDEVRFRRRQWLQANGYTLIRGLAHRMRERLPGPLPCLLLRSALGNIALLGRADHGDFSADVRAKLHQLAQVMGGAVAHRLLAMVEVHP